MDGKHGKRYKIYACGVHTASARGLGSLLFRMRVRVPRCGVQVPADA